MNAAALIGKVIGLAAFVLWTGYATNVGEQIGRKKAINEMRDVLFEDIVKKHYGEESKEESKEVESN